MMDAEWCTVVSLASWTSIVPCWWCYLQLNFSHPLTFWSQPILFSAALTSLTIATWSLRVLTWPGQKQPLSTKSSLQTPILASLGSRQTAILSWGLYRNPSHFHKFGASFLERHLRIVLTTYTSFLLSTHWNNSKQNCTPEGLIIFHLLHETCFLN